MLRATLLLFVTVPLLAAPVPEPSKATKERKALLVELGLPDTGQKLAHIPNDYLADKVTDADLTAKPQQYPVRVACRKLANVLLAHRTDPLPQTFSFAAGMKKAKQDLKAVQVKVAERTLDLDEAVEVLEVVLAKHPQAEKSKRWQATAELLLAMAQQESVALNEYNLLIGRVFTETVEPPSGEFNALRMDSSPKITSSRLIRGRADEARQELRAVIADHPNTPWAEFAESALDRQLGLVWTPVKLSNSKK